MKIIAKTATLTLLFRLYVSAAGCGSLVFNPITNTLDCVGSAAAATTPGTPLHSLQFNNPLGTFAGSASLTWEKDYTATLEVGTGDHGVADNNVEIDPFDIVFNQSSAHGSVVSFYVNNTNVAFFKDNQIKMTSGAASVTLDVNPGNYLATSGYEATNYKLFSAIIGTDTGGLGAPAAGTHKLYSTAAGWCQLDSASVETCFGAGAAPGGSATELQYRAGASTFGAMAGTSWDNTARFLQFLDASSQALIQISADPAGYSPSQPYILTTNSGELMRPPASAAGVNGGGIQLETIAGGNATQAGDAFGGNSGDLAFETASGGTAVNGTTSSYGGSSGNILFETQFGANSALTPDAGTGGNSGSVVIYIAQAGTGLGTVTAQGGTGGTVQITSGFGGDAGGGVAADSVGGNAGGVYISTGNGGSALTGNTRTGGNGGNITLAPGAKGTGSTADGVAGKVVIQGAVALENGTCTAATLSTILTTRDQCYCTDCTVTSGSDNTCAGSGSGALAVSVNSVAKCLI